MRQVRKTLEKLLEKQMNKQGTRCPVGHDEVSWQYAGTGVLNEKVEAVYFCNVCLESFYYEYIKFYNSAENKG